VYRNPLTLIVFGSPFNFLVSSACLGMGLPWRTAWRR
jgi:hypothetical protein